LVLALLAAGVASVSAGAQDAASIPANVTEVTTGGAWTKDGQTGAFRAIVIMGAENEPPVRVYVQLVEFSKGGAIANVLKTVPVKEVPDRKLQNAFVNFDAEAEGKATLIITSYDAAKDSDNSIYAEVNDNGDYKIIEPPKEEPADAAKPK
jgi:hypothetical protein